MAKKAVVGIFDSPYQAESCLNRLNAAGFAPTDISVLTPDKEGVRDFIHEKATKAPEGVATGATTGGVIGGVAGWLVGIGSLAIPGVGPFIAAGPIMAALGGAAIGAATGGIAGGLIGLGMPEYEAKQYEAKVKEGGHLNLRSLRNIRGGRSRQRNFTEKAAQGTSPRPEKKGSPEGMWLKPVAARQSGGPRKLGPLFLSPLC
ncbi:MAG: hypothetical protein MPW15_01735 [Candidatus Manganitrophus sp.]|nr:hypothetical protein [Candidatus Manganitrophus sp.]